MEQIFGNLIFFEELEAWDFLLSLKETRFDMPDGHYFVEFIEDKQPFQLRYERSQRFENSERMEEFLYDVPFWGPRFKFHIEKKQTLCIAIESRFLNARVALEGNDWKQQYYRDLVLECDPQKVVFPTPEEAKAMMEKLSKMLLKLPIIYTKE